MSTATQTLLADAKAKYHQLLTGQAVKVSVDRNGERVEFNTANRSALAEYVRELEQAAAGGSLATRRPLDFRM